ncbi:hypothetical protein D9M69_701310 [compost metagenome]
MLVDHPQVHVFHRLEVGVLHRLKRQAVLLADAVAVVSVDQHVAPQHQRVAAALAQDAALQRLEFVRRQGVYVGFEVRVDGDVHGSGFGGGKGARIVDGPRWATGGAAPWRVGVWSRTALQMRIVRI